MRPVITELVAALAERRYSDRMLALLRTRPREQCAVPLSDLLWWFGRRVRYGARPLLDHPRGTIERLRQLLADVPELQELFIIENGQLNYRAEVTPAERAEIDAYVAARYKVTTIA